MERVARCVCKNGGRRGENLGYGDWGIRKCENIKMWLIMRLNFEPLNI